MSGTNRRDLIKTAVMAPLAARIKTPGANPFSPASRPLAISSANGLRAVEKAYTIVADGGDPIDAVVAGVNIVEDDPNDVTVGYGGIPNEDGVVQLDASVMDGRTMKCGAVGALEGIKNPSKVARLVMQQTNRVFLVGPGELKFARAHGFQEENLLTERSRKIWLYWKERLSQLLRGQQEGRAGGGRRLVGHVRRHRSVHALALCRRRLRRCEARGVGVPLQANGAVGRQTVDGRR
jgi:N4-(beta-N-acetylglucosaminyl)-L-asparaginase